MSTPVEKLRNSLAKLSGVRSPEDIREIGSYIYNIKFFESLRDNKPVFNELCTYLVYEHFYPNEYVFKMGDFGDKFYILIEGQVSILVPDKHPDGQPYFKEIIRLQSGASFGDLALLDNKPRAASIKTVEECHFAVLDRNNYQRILASIMKQKKLEIVSFLQSQPIFKSFTKGSLTKLSYCFEEKIYRKHFVLFSEGSKVDFLYLLKDGEVKLSKKIKMTKVDFQGDNKYKDQLNKRFSQNAELSLVGQGEFLGLYDMEKGVYETTAICSSKRVVLFKISIGEFNKRLNITEINNTIKQRKVLKDVIHESCINSIQKVIKEKESSPYRKFSFAATPTLRSKDCSTFTDSPLLRNSFDKNTSLAHSKISKKIKLKAEKLLDLKILESRSKNTLKFVREKYSEEAHNFSEFFSRLMPFGKRKSPINRKSSILINIHKKPSSTKNIQATRFFSKAKDLLSEKLLNGRLYFN